VKSLPLTSLPHRPKLLIGSKPQHVPLLRVLKAHFDPESRILNVAYLAERGGKNYSPLVNIEGKVEDQNVDSTTASWVENVLQACYEGPPISTYLQITTHTCTKVFLWNAHVSY
jgi:hypothetical protein